MNYSDEPFHTHIYSKKFFRKSRECMHNSLARWNVNPPLLYLSRVRKNPPRFFPLSDPFFPRSIPGPDLSILFPRRVKWKAPPGQCEWKPRGRGLSARKKRASGMDVDARDFTNRAIRRRRACGETVLRCCVYIYKYTLRLDRSVRGRRLAQVTWRKTEGVAARGKVALDYSGGIVVGFLWLAVHYSRVYIYSGWNINAMRVSRE